MGLSSTATGVESGKPTHFTVLTKGAGKAVVDASFSSPVKDFDIIDNYDYSQTVKYTPAKQVGQLRLSVWARAPPYSHSNRVVLVQFGQRSSETTESTCPRGDWLLSASPGLMTVCRGN